MRIEAEKSITNTHKRESVEQPWGACSDDVNVREERYTNKNRHGLKQIQINCGVSAEPR